MVTPSAPISENDTFFDVARLLAAGGLTSIFPVRVSIVSRKCLGREVGRVGRLRAGRWSHRVGRAAGQEQCAEDEARHGSLSHTCPLVDGDPTVTRAVVSGREELCSGVAVYQGIEIREPIPT